MRYKRDSQLEMDARLSLRRGNSPLAYSYLDSCVCPNRRKQKKKYNLLFSVGQNFPRLKLPLSSQPRGQFSLQTSRHTGIRGNDIRVELNGDLRGCSFLLFFFISLSSFCATRTIVRILKCQSERRGCEKKVEKTRRNIRYHWTRATATCLTRGNNEN